MPFILDPGKKIPIKIVMKLKKLKNHCPTFFLAKMGCDRPRKIEKNFTSEFRSNPPRARKFRKSSKKIEKIKKNSFRYLFLAKTGRDRPRKREKNFTHECRSYSTRPRKFRKK